MVSIDRLLASALSEIDNCLDVKKLPAIKNAAIGKNSPLAQVSNDMKKLSVEEKKTLGMQINFVKQKILEAVTAKENELNKALLEERLANEYIDVTMPSRTRNFGKLHPITKAYEEVYNIMTDMGLTFVDGPDIETDFYNFTALNIPEHHPARTMHDTFYVNMRSDNKLLLRTHTSTVQIRSMEKDGAPLRVFSIGRTYRSDSDATHTPMFHQVEALVIDENINFAHLKWMAAEFFKKFFEVDELNIRLRPSFFPFTEPSAEIDMAYTISNNKMVFGKGDNWLEMGGCGIVHPNVLRNSGVDPEKYQGFAWGIGLERITSLKYGIPDLRQYFEFSEKFERNFYFDSFMR